MILAWVNMHSDGPAPNTTTPDPMDRYNAASSGLSGNSDGHGVCALLELIDVDGMLRLVALGRRLDEGKSQTFAPTADWRTLLPRGEWVQLAATYVFRIDSTMSWLALRSRSRHSDKRARFE